MAYLVYGRRQKKFVPLMAGVLLCTCPYFIDSLAWLCVVGALLMVAPFVIDFSCRSNYPWQFECCNPSPVLFVGKQDQRFLLAAAGSGQVGTALVASMRKKRYRGDRQWHVALQVCSSPQRRKR